MIVALASADPNAAPATTVALSVASVTKTFPLPAGLSQRPVSFGVYVPSSATGTSRSPQAQGRRVLLRGIDDGDGSVRGLDGHGPARPDGDGRLQRRRRALGDRGLREQAASRGPAARGPAAPGTGGLGTGVQPGTAARQGAAAGDRRLAGTGGGTGGAREPAAPAAPGTGGARARAAPPAPAAHGPAERAGGGSVTPPSLTACMEYDHNDANDAPCDDDNGISNWEIWSLAFSPDGRLLATAGDDGRVKIWNFDGHTLTASGHVISTNGQTYVAFSPDGATLVVGSNGKLVTYNTASWTLGPPSRG